VVHESWCHATPPPTLNRQPQEGQGTQGHGKEDRTMDIGKVYNACDKRSGKMGMMGRWMEVGAHQSIKVKLITSSLSNAY